MFGLLENDGCEFEVIAQHSENHVYICTTADCKNGFNRHRFWLIHKFSTKMCGMITYIFAITICDVTKASEGPPGKNIGFLLRKSASGLPININKNINHFKNIGLAYQSSANPPLNG